MVSENQLKDIIEQVINEMGTKGDSKKECNNNLQCDLTRDEELTDITKVDIKEQLLVENPENKEAYLKLKENSPARIGVGRTGSRYKTESLLRFRADHAVAMDAVFTYVSEEYLKEMGWLSIDTQCKDKDEYLTRPDLGRKFGEDAINKIKENCKHKPQVQIYISDGLSSTAIETNAKDTLAAIIQGLNVHGIDVGTPFFVKHGRVPAMDMVSEILEPEVTVVLIGERPGLATAESMSCYMAYKSKVGMPESRRTVISNIHKGGTPAVEAGAHISDIIKKMLEQKASGLDLKL
ncbi:ethanolamine ammonia-lyase subunit EutC [Dethiothermospora halolimnae]|uniref:ethanolamine ammonia-lyase subunit EutC n=1 Tax=Dethiothermospora halolimnae TaxID=3114390 RepID=UPI003CCB8DB7